MKRTALALTLILALLFSSLVGAMLINSGTANPIGLSNPWDPKPKINILFPQNNTAYQTANFQLNFTLDLSEWYDYSTEMNPEYSFSLGPIEYHLDGKLAGQITGHLSEEAYNLSVPLVGLTDGLHTVEVTATTSGEYWNTTYESNGPHHNLVNGVTNGTSGKIYFTVKNVKPFPTTQSPEPQQSEPFPTTLVAAIIASVVVISAGMLVYFRKRKH